ncbi:MAG: CPBP family intramembrane glutamic endopeptidase, partial [Rubrobacter sp.]
MRILIESERGRPRAAFRLLVQFSIYFFLSLLFISLLRGSLLILPGGSGSTSQTSSSLYVAASIGSLVATLLSLLIASRFLDRRPFRDYGFHLTGDWFIDLGFGLALGAILMSGIFLTQLALGWVSVTGTFYSGFDRAPFVLGILPPLIVFLCVGVYEEAASRGYQMKNLSEGLDFPALGGRRGAVVLSWVATSAVFGLLHLGNPNADLTSTLNIALAGLLLGVGYVLTGELAIPIGLHITWNFFQGSVFGFPVSGLTGLGGSFITIEQSGPAAWTGGDFGPEAGLL